MSRYIPPGTWEAIHRDWRLGRDCSKVIARRHGIHESSIPRYAKQHGWGARGAEHDDPVLNAEVALDDILFELNRKLAAMRDPAALGTLKTAGEDARLVFSVIRDIRRAVAEVKKAQGEARADGSSGAPAITVLDFESAKKEVLDRFDNLAAWIARDRAEHPDEA